MSRDNSTEGDAGGGAGRAGGDAGGGPGGGHSGDAGGEHLRDALQRTAEERASAKEAHTMAEAILRANDETLEDAVDQAQSSFAALARATEGARTATDNKVSKTTRHQEAIVRYNNAIACRDQVTMATTFEGPSAYGRPSGPGNDVETKVRNFRTWSNKFVTVMERELANFATELESATQREAQRIEACESARLRHETAQALLADREWTAYMNRRVETELPQRVAEALAAFNQADQDSVRAEAAYEAYHNAELRRRVAQVVPEDARGTVLAALDRIHQLHRLGAVTILDLIEFAEQLNVVLLNAGFESETPPARGDENHDIRRLDTPLERFQEVLVVQEPENPSARYSDLVSWIDFVRTTVEANRQPQQ